MSRPIVRPMEVEVFAGHQPQVRMADVPGKPGTLLSLGFRSAQFLCAAVVLTLMATTHYFKLVPSFGFVVAAAGLLLAWSLVLAVLDLYALLVRRHLRRLLLGQLLSVGDGTKGTVILKHLLIAKKQNNGALRLEAGTVC